jgi:hypothetical protein
MKYLCIIYGDGNSQSPLSESELEKYASDILGYHDQLRQRGQLSMSQALKPDAATVRNRSGKVTTTDGPFMETKEQMAGAFILEARDLNEALRLVQDHPLAEGDAIDIHQMFDPRD